ncbi:MAG: transglutaminase family protein [Verrucomicrobiales bacterium]
MKIFETAPDTWEQIHLTHETIYTYGTVVKFLPHRLVLRPREGHLIRLNTMNLTATPAPEIVLYRDMLDNAIATATFQESASELRILSEFRVSVPPESPEDYDPIFVTHPADIAGIEQMVAVPYLQYIYPHEVTSLRDWFAGAGLAPRAGEFAPLFDNMAALIHRVIKYTRREAMGVQSPTETLALSTGSCRDMAVLMMETSRALGYPARFVSGYLETSNSMVGRGSTHGWTEVYLPDHGWVGYDPSIGKRVGPRHIAVGVSHHPRGVMPVSGGYVGPGGVSSSLIVRITTERLPPFQPQVS